MPPLVLKKGVEAPFLLATVALAAPKNTEKKEKKEKRGSQNSFSIGNGGEQSSPAQLHLEAQKKRKRKKGEPGSSQSLLSLGDLGEQSFLAQLLPEVEKKEIKGSRSSPSVGDGRPSRT